MGKHRFEYEYPMGREAQVGIRGHRAASWDAGKRRTVPAVRRQFVKFHKGYFGTDDVGIARALEDTGPWERNEIRRAGAKRSVRPSGGVAPRAVVRLPEIEAMLVKLGGLPAGSDDGELDAIRLR